MTTTEQLDPTVIERLDQLALRLVGIVHGDGEARDIVNMTRALTREQIIGLAISCAAMVDPDKSLDELLEWLDPSTVHFIDGYRWTESQIREAHAAYVGGDRRQKIQRGEKAYHRLNYSGAMKARR